MVISLLWCINSVEIWTSFGVFCKKNVFDYIAMFSIDLMMATLSLIDYTRPGILYSYRYTTCQSKLFTEPQYPKFFWRYIFWIFHGHFNSFPSSAAYMRQWIGSTLIQIMAYRLFDAKPSSKPMIVFLSIWPLGTNFSEILNKIQDFSFTKMHPKISSAKWRPFCPAGDELIQIRQYYFTDTTLQNMGKYTLRRYWEI